MKAVSDQNHPAGMACFMFVEAFFMMVTVTFVVVRMTENGEFFQ